MPTPSSCTCLICHPDPAGTGSTTVETVQQHGWLVLWVAGSFDFAYTVGLWHSFGQPEIVMFGLEGDGMQIWLNACVDLGRERGWPAVNEPFHGVLDGFETQFRDVDPSWNRALFGTALGFYRGTAVPFRQLVWPDRNGEWPWDDKATVSSRTRQAFAWLPVDEHPPGAWRLVGELGPDFPFAAGPDSFVLTTRSLLDGGRTVASVRYDQGSYDILDERGHVADDLCLAFLGDVVRRHPHIRAFGDLADGQSAAACEDGSWTRSYLTAADRRASKRAWTLAEPV